MIKPLLLILSVLGSFFFTPIGQRLRSYEDIRWIREGIVVTSNTPSPKGFEPIKTVDGDESFDSRWIGADNPDPGFQYELKYDLIFVRTIYKIEMVTNGPYPAQKIGNVRQYDVFISLDDSNYVKLYSSPILPDTTYVDSYMFVPTHARYIKVVINSKYGIHPEIREFKIFTVSPIRYEKKLIKKVTASSSASGSDPKSTLDLYSGKPWASKKGESPPVFVTYELVDLMRVEGIRIRTGGPRNTVKQYDVLVSTDGRTFSKVASSKELPDQPTLDEISFPPTWARFIRISINQWHGDWAEMKGFEIIRSVSGGMTGHPVLLFYDDCGNDEKQPHLRRGRNFSEWKDIDPRTSQPEKDVAYDDDRVVLRYTGLNPSDFYGVEVTYIQDRGDLRRQALYAGQYEVHGDLLLPDHRARRYCFDIPPMAYSNGTLTLTFKKLTGPNAVVSEVRIYKLLQPNLLRGSSSPALWRAFRAISPISIDGDLSEWALLSPLKLGKSRVWIQWDDSSLYISGEISLGDGPLEILLDPKADSHDFLFGPDDLHLLLIPPTEKDSLPIVKLIHHLGDSFSENIILGKDLADCASRMKDDGWSFELKIPRDKLLGNIALSQGGKVRANIVLRSGDKLLSWTGDTSEYESYAPIFFNTISLYGPTKAAISLKDIDGKEMSKVLAGSSFKILIADADKDVDPEKKDFVQVRVRSKPTGDLEIVKLMEEGPDMGIFSGSIPTEFGTSPIVGDYAVQVRGGDDVVVEYEDETFVAVDPGGLISISCKVATGSDGELFILRPGRYEMSKESSIRCGDEILVELFDEDLKGKGHVKVKIAGTLTGSSQDLDLSELPESPGRFRGNIKTIYSEKPTYDKGPLGIVGGEILLVTYMDALRSNGETNIPVIARALVEVGSTGVLKILSMEGEEISSFRSGNILRISVRDPDISELERIRISLEGEKTGDKEEIWLRRSSQDEALFIGEIRTEYGTASIAGDGLLTVQGNETITATYMDEIQETGKTNVQVVAKARVEVGTTAEILLLERDLCKRLLSFKARDPIWVLVKDPDRNTRRDSVDSVDVTISGQGGTLGRISLFETNPDSGVFVGELLTRFWMDDIKLGGIPVRGGEDIVVTYIDEIQSTGRTNIPVSSSAKVVKGYTGEVSLLKDWDGEEVDIVSPGDILWVRLVDPDLNDPDVVDGAIVRLLGDSGDSMELRLLETGADTGTFLGAFRTSYSYVGIPSNQQLEIKGEGKLKLIYIDDLSSDGAREVEISKEYEVLRFLRALRAIRGPKIDGDLKDWPTGSFAEIKGEDGRVFGRVYVQWDEGNIYLGADITTGFPPTVRDPRNFSYGSDSILIFLDTELLELPPYLLGSVGPGNHLFWFMPLGGGKDGKEAYCGQWHRPGDSIMETIFGHRDIDVKARLKGDGYTMEVRIPRGKVIKELNRYRKIWGFNCHLFFSSGGRVEWAKGTRGLERVDPAWFGRLEMVDSIPEIPPDLLREEDLAELDLSRLEEEAKAHGVDIGDKVEEEIRHYGIFWKDGGFNEDLYKSLRAEGSIGWDDIEMWERKKLLISEMVRKAMEDNPVTESEVREEFLRRFRRIRAQAFVLPDPGGEKMVKKRISLKGIVLPISYSPRIVVRNEDVEDFYARNLEIFRVPETRKIRAIPVKDEEMAKEIVKVLSSKDGLTPFELTRSLGVGRWFENGCDLGYVKRGDLIPELQVLAFSADEGAIIGPFRIKDKLWILKVERIMPSFLKGLEEARDTIYAFLREEKEKSEMGLLIPKVKELLEQGRDPKDVAEGLKLRVWDPGKPINRITGLDRMLEGAKAGDIMGPVDLPIGTLIAKVEEISILGNVSSEMSSSYDRALDIASRLKKGEEILDPDLIALDIGPATRNMMERWGIGDEGIDAIFSASPGDVVGPLRTKSGYIVLKILERDDGEEKYKENATSILSEIISRRKEKVVTDIKDKVMVKGRGMGKAL